MTYKISHISCRVPDLTRRTHAGLDDEKMGQTSDASTHRGAVVEIDDGGEEVLLRDGFKGGVQRVCGSACAVHLPRTRANVQFGQTKRRTPSRP
jgi:hypothetical protein